MNTLERSQYIEIGLGRERYAIRIETIQEIIRMQPITEIPGTGADIRGVINLRGKIVPVVCLRDMFGGGSGKANDRSHQRIVVVGSGQEQVGFIVDRVHHVASYSRIQPAPDWGGQAGEAATIRGVGHSEEHVVSIMELETIVQRGGV
ncbi:chemotaxis protein CheW [Paenibacillus koleovorans]|uniref:chemotaxis protein CheW n=1 Tax=Paenibacillus koleovorans TaxID=121608 RepID=UPI0013E384D0|nr:chemotaxis protein CheW [Paenibacillus koleovorans]